MRIRMTHSCATLGGPCKKGKEYDVTDERGKEFVKLGWAVELKPTEPAQQPAATVTTATAPAATTKTSLKTTTTTPAKK